MIPVFEPDIGEEEIASVVDGAAPRRDLRKLRRGAGQLREGVRGLLRMPPRRRDHERHDSAAPRGGRRRHRTRRRSAGQREHQHRHRAGRVSTTAPLPCRSTPRRTTWNLDLDLIEALITPRTQAIMPVHLFGHPGRHGPAHATSPASTSSLVIEDCAEAHGATVSRPARRQLRRHGLLQLLRQQDHHHRRRRHGRDQRRRAGGTPAAAAQSRLHQAALLARGGRLQLPHDRLSRRPGPGAVAAHRRHRRGQAAGGAHYTDRLLARCPACSCRSRRSGRENVYWMYGVVVQPEFGMTRDQLMARLARKASKRGRSSAR